MGRADQQYRVVPARKSGYLQWSTHGLVGPFAALRLRFERGRERVAAGGDRDGCPGRVRAAHARPGRPGRESL